MKKKKENNKNMEERPVKCEGCPYFYGSLACDNCNLQN